MKKIIKITFLLFVALGLFSCNEWLDVNTNPDSPTNVIASPEQRLPWIQHYYLYGYGAAAVRAAEVCGVITSTTFTGTNGLLPAWNPTNGASTTPYQFWFVGSASNIPDLITKAEEEEAWHYIGAAYTIRAMGFMLMTDWYGEMPYEASLGSSLSPEYNDGQTIFEGCLDDLDEALRYFQMSQPATAPSLADGDSWNNGDVNKWIKLIYGLKARWLNNLSKKSTYDPDAVLAAINNAPANNTEAIAANHVNDMGDLTGDILFGDPLKTCVIFNSAAWSDWARFTKYYTDKLTDLNDSGVLDPRAEKMLPSAQHYITTTSPSGETVTSVVYKITEGVDAINSDIRLNSGPMLATYSPSTQTWRVSNAATDERKNDTVYVSLKVLCAMTGATSSESSNKATDNTILSTGTFYTRPESPTDILSYYEMCFIKAEAYFRKGDRVGAYAAYKEGILAHMERINTKLREYNSDIPAKQAMEETDIEAYLKSAAVVQEASRLTMADIMQQKFIAMTFTQQTWNDMRRFNFSAGNMKDFGVVYPGFDRPKEFSATAATKITGTSKTETSYWFRRFMQCSHEVNYNAENLKASHPRALETDIWCQPVWWDIEE